MSDQKSFLDRCLDWLKANPGASIDQCAEALLTSRLAIIAQAHRQRRVAEFAALPGVRIVHDRVSRPCPRERAAELQRLAQTAIDAGWQVEILPRGYARGVGCPSYDDLRIFGR
ncbi:hypothetical protein [Salinarimonas rosea]|uniref:hypothetical protein n=1 Tax=Salinarimonas rosea TaxID=552063 RepID=UPI000404BAB7|nr:hypothetical protein [Salinarimonas rosea]